MRGLLIGLSFCIASMAYGQATDKPVPPVHGKAEASDKNKKQPAPKQEIAVTLPSSVNVNLGGKLDVKGEYIQKRADEEPNKWIEKWIDPVTWFTFVLAAANVFLWLSTRKAAKAAADAADYAGKSATPLLMPYVLPENFDLHPLVPIQHPTIHPARFLLTFNNYGTTPATILGVRAELIVTIRDDAPRGLQIDDWEFVRYNVIIPRDFRWKDLETGALDLRKNISFTPSELNELLSEADPHKTFRRLALIGHVVYDDIFGYRHTRRFCIKMRAMPMVVSDRKEKSGFYSIQEAIHIRLFQVSQGPSEYSTVVTERIPNPDPLAT